MTLQEELDLVRQHLAQVENEVKELRNLLQHVPHGRGDHTDFCRMANDGLPPEQNEHCRCHVAMIRKTLTY